MNSTLRFSNRVENYVRFRPSYPREIIQLMQGEMDLSQNSVIADVGSGTGIFSKLLLESGCAVYGIEPNAPMRAAGEEFLANFPKFKSIAGAAENTNLPCASVDFVTAAQAFHWFDVDAAKMEFCRILKPDGFVILIWNERRFDADAFSSDYERFLIEHGDDYEKVRSSHAQELTVKQFFNNDFTVKSYSNVQTLDYTGFKGRTLSSSYMPTEQDARFPETIAALDRVFARHNDNGTVKIYYETKVFYRKF